jgi:hypothetical protein
VLFGEDGSDQTDDGVAVGKMRDFIGGSDSCSTIEEIVDRAGRVEFRRDRESLRRGIRSTVR